MIKSIILALAIVGTLQELQIIEPVDLRESISSLYDMSHGSLVYSVSTFGDILLSERSVVEVIMPAEGNINGCENVTHPEDLTTKKFVWLMERGVCTYSKKAFISQQSGAFAVLVYHNSEDADIANIIPCADAICKLSRQQHQDPDHPDIQGRRAQDQGLAGKEAEGAGEHRTRAGGLTRRARRPIRPCWTTGCRRAR